jgi:EF hand
MKATFILVLGGICACGAIADASDVRTARDVRSVRDVEVVFDSLDRNGDQRISKQEAAQKRTLRRRFGGVDADRDGYLSKAEFQARPSPQPFE